MSPTDTLINPATEEPFRTIPLMGEQELLGVVARARSAQREWRRVPVAERVRLVSQMVPAFRAMADQAALDITRQMGKPLQQSHNEINTMIDRAETMGRLAESALADEPLPIATEFGERALTVARDRKERGGQGYALRLLAEMASSCDPPDVETAEARYREPLALAEELGMRPLVAHCRLGLGTLHRRTGRQQQAEEHLVTATAMYREMEMQFWVARAEAERKLGVEATVATKPMSSTAAPPATAAPASAPAPAPAPSPPAPQPGKVHRIGLLTGASAVSRLAPDSPAFETFRRALAELGYVEGQNLAFERRDAEGRWERLAGLAGELVQLGMEVIFAPSTSDAEAAKAATSTVPIVFVGADPVGTGLVRSLERPGGNVTGLTVASHARGRRLALLKEVVPGLSRVAVLVNLAYASVPFQLRQTEMAARSLAVSLQRLEVRDSKDLNDALIAVTRGHADGLIVLHHPLFAREARRLADFAVRSRTPMLAPYARVAEAGGLLAYEPDMLYPFRRAASYIDRILKGANPGQLPVEESTKFSLVVNLRAARTLGLRVPQALRARADQVIEDRPTAGQAPGTGVS